MTGLFRRGTIQLLALAPLPPSFSSPVSCLFVQKTPGGSVFPPLLDQVAIFFGKETTSRSDQSAEKKANIGRQSGSKSNGRGETRAGQTAYTHKPAGAGPVAKVGYFVYSDWSAI